MHRKARLSHITSRGGIAMVDVAAKPDQHRTAIAQGEIRMAPTTLQLLRKKALPKGDALVTAQIAGIQAAKRTSELIPLCHPLSLHEIAVDFEILSDRIRIQARVVTLGKTGVEMEALTAASVAALTLYDMCKAVDKKMVIGGLRILAKIKL